MFVGTRVPVRSLFEHLESGESIDSFLDGIPFAFAALWRVMKSSPCPRRAGPVSKNGELLRLAAREFDVFAAV